MSRLRSTTFIGIILLFPLVQLLDWALASTAINAIIGNFNMNRADRGTDSTLTRKADNVVTRLRRDELANTYEPRFAPLRPFLPLDQKIGYVFDLGWREKGVIPFIYIQYALAPAVITDSEDTKYVIANFSSESVLDRLIEGQVTICHKFTVAADSREADQLLDIAVTETRPVIAPPRLLKVDYQRELYRCGGGGLRIVRRFGGGVAILERLTEDSL